MKRLLSILLWSAIAAAFLGPGTVTTAAGAGARHGLALLWALVFSTVATYVLQEASARLTVVSGRELGRVLRDRYRGGVRGALVLVVVLGAVLLGCAAYEAGNLLGGVAGALLAVDLPRWLLTVVTGAVAALLLALGSPTRVARGLAVLVAVMGAGFLVAAALLEPPPAELLRGALVPTWPTSPEGAGFLVLALVGTTVVPYNLFLGSGLARGQDLRETRLGLAVAVGLGGLISMGVLVVGTAVTGEFGFEALAAVLAERLGAWARVGFAAGLFAAGLSSAVTAPLAAALTARGLFGDDDEAAWAPTGGRFRVVWAAVLLVGVGFGVADVKPIPAILLAQALNGILLPLVAVFLLMAVNDRRLLGEHVNGRAANVVTVLVVGVTLVLGGLSLGRVAEALLG